ncbi:MAG TPA: hypothetical protein DCP28_12345, partial [Cytophagales bacterium]|nr:hypothetical protein [Cytophagales bacterium]
MLKNQMTFALRAFRKHARISFLNLLGLTIGLASALLISLYVWPELQADQHHPLGERIYKVNWEEYREDGDHRTYALTGGVMAPRLYEESSAVANFCRFQPHTAELLLKPENRSPVKGEGVLFTDSSFFTFFPVPMLSGDPATCLVTPASIVLTESLAQKLFGDQEAMGQVVEGHRKLPYTVTGVIPDPDPYSHFTYDALVSWSTTVPNVGPLNWEWMNREAGNIHTYILLPEGADPLVLQRALDQYSEDLEYGDDNRLVIQSMPEMYLHSAGVEFMLPGRVGDYQTILVLIALGIFILVNACINYINIQTARANERLREMGMRKTMGATRKGLIAQILAETLVLTFVASVLAYVIAQSVAPGLARWVGMNLDVSLLVDPGYLAIYLGLGLVLSLLAGGYPALVLSGFHPSEAFTKHITMARSGGRLRQVLTTVQFATSLLVITGTLVIYQQVRFQQNKDLGFDLNQVVQLPLSTALDSLQENFQLALENVPGVEQTSISLDVLGAGGTSSVTGISQVGGVDYEISGRYFGMDEDFSETYGLRVMEGRSFDKDLQTDWGKVMINETLAKLVGWEPATGQSPIGSDLHLYGNTEGMEIIGIVEDMHLLSMRYKVEPLVMQHIGNTNAGTISVRIDATQTASVLAGIEQVWGQYDSEYPFEFSFVDQQYASMFAQEQTLFRGMTFFSLVSLFMAVLGLFGLTSYVVINRKREIGIRKVLGAPIADLLWRINHRMAILFGVALIIALPTSFYLLQDWLSNFAYRIELSPVAFAMGALGTLL